MSVSGAVFDMVKLLDVSKNVISKFTAERIYNETLKWATRYDKELQEWLEKDKEYAIRILNIERGTAKPRKDIAKWSDVKDTIIDIIEKNVDLLDSSVSDFIDVVSAEISPHTREPGSTKEAFKILGDFLVNVFDDPQTVIDICVNDEHVCKWDWIDTMNKQCADRAIIMPSTVMFFTVLNNNNIELEHLNGKKFTLAGCDLSGTDYMFAVKQDKPIMFNIGGVKLSDLTANQKQLYTAVRPRLLSAGWAAFVAQGSAIFAPFDIPGYYTSRTENAIYNIEECLILYTDKFYFTPIQELIDYKRPDGTPILKPGSFAQTLLPKEIIEKYGFEIKSLS